MQSAMATLVRPFRRCRSSVSPVLLAFSIFYALVLTSVALGNLRTKRSRALADSECPAISIIVCARNEENDLPACIDALLALDYPRDRVELLLIDDASTDATGQIIAAARARDQRIVALTTEGTPQGVLRGKARALATAASRARGEWILVTDADARVSPAWPRHLLDGADATVGMVGGGVFAYPRGLVGLFEWWVDCLITPAGTGIAGHGAAFTCFGPNMGFRREVYERSGGLEAAARDGKLRVAEDLALFTLITRSGYRTLVKADAATVVRLTPVSSIVNLFSKWRRWYLGGFEGPVAVWLPTAFLVTVRILISYAFLVGLVMAPWRTLPCMALVAAANTVPQGIAQWRFGQRGIVWLAPLFELFCCVAWSILGVSLLVSRRIRWRGEGYVIRFEEGAH